MGKKKENLLEEIKSEDLTGMKFGKLEAIMFDYDKYEKDKIRAYKNEIKQARSYWVCKCECGNTIIASLDKLKYGNKKSCGCDKTNTRTFSYDKVKKIIEVTGCTLLSDVYDNNTTPLDIKCKCGNIFTTTLKNFNTQGKTQCDNCGELKRKINLRNKNREESFNDGRFCPCNYCDKQDIQECMDCKTYSYFKRNKRILLDNWSGSEYITIIDSILNNKVDCLNDILLELNNKTLDDLVLLLVEQLITCCENSASKIKVECACCDKTMYRTKVEYNKERQYCSLECRDKTRSVLFTGKNSPSFNSKNCLCTNCGTNMLLPPNKYNQKNSYGDTHVFCSRNCYSEYRSKYYVKEKSYFYGRVVSDEEKIKMSIRTTDMLRKGLFPQTLTKPHVKVNELLDNMGITYTNEYSLKYYSLDIYCEEKCLMIEVMGDYWHGHPLKYEYYDDLSEIQQKAAARDKRKHTYVKKYYNSEILYLWENDINNNIELCKALIHSYVDNNKKLYDYNSYNYNINSEGFLVLNDICFDPYFIERIF